MGQLTIPYIFTVNLTVRAMIKLAIATTDKSQRLSLFYPSQSYPMSLQGCLLYITITIIIT